MIDISKILNAKILIVDDQEANVLLLKRILTAAGYSSIMSTQNSLEVCELHKKNNFDLILLDLQMPVMDGFQVMDELKLIEKIGYLPVLVITAQPNEKLRALRAGAKDFVSKPFEISEVIARVQNLIEVRLLNIETKTLFDQVLVEKKISDRLLQNVLPQSIVQRLKSRNNLSLDNFSEVIADSYPEVTVLFADIVDFTTFSKYVSAETVVVILNKIFTSFDKIAGKRGLEKIKTIGDCYMAAAGLPVAVANHAELAAHMAFDMLENVQLFNEQSNHQLILRIGISTGTAVAGVIGQRKFQYDVWGDVVNTASRMESMGIAGKIQITDSTRQKLGKDFSIEKRGIIDVKGQGKMNTWLLNSRREEKLFQDYVR